MPFPILARKMRKLATQQFLQLKQLLTGRGFAKFKRIYRIKGELGQGGFGVVYRGVRLADGLPVAVKFIERRHVREWGRLDEQRVPMEICMLARCARVPGVIGLLDWFALPEGFLLVMERPSPCIDLFDFIHQQKCLDEPLARFLFRQLVRAVADCGERRVLHRDLKDENVLLELATGRVRLIDFGAATLLNRQRYTDFQGTRLYCPPEWFLHSLYLGKEAAVWSLGVLLYNMLNGRLPFLNEKDICTAHLLGPLPFFAPLSKEVRDLLGQCLNFDPFSRPSLEQMLAHPWLSRPGPEWIQLVENYTKQQTSETEGENAEERGELEIEEDEERQQQESGLASDGEYSGAGSMAISSGFRKLKILQAPSAVASSSSCHQQNGTSKGCRRNARTAHHFGWKDGGREGGGEEDTMNPDGNEIEESMMAYSIVRPSLRQFELCPPQNKQTKCAGTAAVGSLDSGTASALHSPRCGAQQPNENPYPQFC